MANDDLNTVAAKFFSRLAPGARDFISGMDDELTNEEADQFVRAISRKIIACQMRIIEERHFSLNPSDGGELMTETEIEAMVNNLLSTDRGYIRTHEG